MAAGELCVEAACETNVHWMTLWSFTFVSLGRAVIVHPWLKCTSYHIRITVFVSVTPKSVRVYKSIHSTLLSLSGSCRDAGFVSAEVWLVRFWSDPLKLTCSWASRCRKPEWSFKITVQTTKVSFSVFSWSLVDWKTHFIFRTIQMFWLKLCSTGHKQLLTFSLSLRWRFVRMSWFLLQHNQMFWSSVKPQVDPIVPSYWTWYADLLR